MSETQASDTYYSISAPSKGLYKELGSKFLSFAYPVTNEEEVKEIITNLKKEYFDARHHCYAYRIGPQGEFWRANDDGEPSSSAGKPILGQLLSVNISDTLIAVVRYFGGTKLGIPGLIRAYRGAALDALSNVSIVEKLRMEKISFSFDYINMEHIMKLVKIFDPQIIMQLFDMRCYFEIEIRLSLYQDFIEALTQIEGVEIKEHN